MGTFANVLIPTSPVLAFRRLVLNVNKESYRQFSASSIFVNSDAMNAELCFL